MNAIEQSTAIHALALSLAEGLSRDEATRLGLLLVQLGTTLSTITALQELDSGIAIESLSKNDRPSSGESQTGGGSDG